MLLVAYYLSRCGQRIDGKPSLPPKKLSAHNWKNAVALFFEPLGNGRTQESFHDSMRAAISTYDHLFPENNRKGWRDKNGKATSKDSSLWSVHEKWKAETDDRLEAKCLEIARGSGHENDNSSEARTEGGVRVYISSRPERDPILREAAIRFHGTTCVCCGFSFKAFYGEYGSGFIEVHHVKPIAEKERVTDPRTDLMPVCPNCHRMIHRTKGVCLSIDEMKKIIARAAGNSD